jgi:hypothetical protein
MKPNKQKIKSIKENLFLRSQESISDYYAFDWHNYYGEIDTNKINSSQAIAIDFWGCLKLSPYRNQIINKLFNKDCEAWEILYEYENKNLLSEKRPTQIDVIVESETFAIIIESKFAESDGGICSQANKTKRGLFQCNGNYEEQTNPINGIKSKCSLTGKGILYWEYIDSLTKFNKGESYLPCPFRKSEFQWMRIICFTEAYAKYKNIQSECYLAYYKSDKCAISKKVENQSYLGELREKIQNSKSFEPLSYNDLLEQIIVFLNLIDKKEKRVWVELQSWMREKERTI